MAIYGLSNLGGNAMMYGGIYGGGGLYSLIGAFNPLSLDPYLLFDTQSSMIGTFENPTLDLDPSVPSSLDIITATRAGTATVTDASGNIVDAAPNTVRVDHVDGVPMILVEPSATNLVPSKVFFGVGTTTIASGFLAPDGSMDAYELSNILDNSSDRVYCVAATVSGSTEYTGSLYVKGTAGEVATIQAKRSGAGAISTSTTSVVTLTGSWQRVTGLTFTTAADNTQAVVSVRREAAATADTIQVWGAQFELGSVATSYIPTSGSTVTRAADDYKIVGTDFTDFWNTSEGTIYVEFQTEIGFTGAQRYVLGSQSNIARFCYLQGASDHTTTYDGGNILLSSYVPKEITRYAVTFEDSVAVDAMRASLNGTAEQVAPHNGNLLSLPTQLNIGSTQAGFEQLNGHIKRLIYWPYHSDSL
jgi:hypothetical protein